MRQELIRGQPVKSGIHNYGLGQSLESGICEMACTVSVSTHDSVRPERSRSRLGRSVIEAQGPIIRRPLSLPPDFHQTAITVLLDLQSTQKK